MSNRSRKTITAVEVEIVIEWLKKNGAGQNVLRSKVEEVSDGLLQSGTLRNNDSNGTGPSERILFNGKIAYPIKPLAEYMVNRGLVIELRVDEVVNG